MKNPDAQLAVSRLRQERVLSDTSADFLLRITRGELVSVYLEFRVAFYVGLLLLTSGIVLLLKEHFDRVGPLGIAVGMALIALLALAWVLAHALAFSWEQVPATHPAFDFILLLAVISMAADAAYIELEFSPLGSQWPWHFFWVSLAAGLLSFRYDSRMLFSFALSSFCSWCGFSVSLGQTLLRHGVFNHASLYPQIIACGLLFLLLGQLLRRSQCKPHFEPTATYLGWMLILLSLGSGIGGRTQRELVFTLLLLSTGIGLTIAIFYRRFLLFALGSISVLIALSALVHRLQTGTIPLLLWYTLAPLSLLAFLILVHRSYRESS